MRTQAPQRTLLNGVLGAADQVAVAKTADPTRTQTIVTGILLLAGGALKTHQVLRRDRRDHPWEGLFADGLLGSGGTIGGQLAAGLVLQQLNKAAQNNPPADTTDPTGDAGQTSTGAASQTGGTYAADSDSDASTSFEAVA